MEESLQFLLNYADIWVWQGLILLCGQSGFCCCRLVCFQLTFFCPHSDPFLDMLLANVCFYLSLQPGHVLCIYIFLFFSIFFLGMTLFLDILFGNVFSLSPQSCHKCPIYILVHFQATSSLSKLISSISLYHSSASRMPVKANLHETSWKKVVSH
jgi:hypothetical protein